MFETGTQSKENQRVVGKRVEPKQNLQTARGSSNYNVPILKEIRGLKKHPSNKMDATSYMITSYFLIVFNVVPILNAGTLRAGTLTALPFPRL